MTATIATENWLNENCTSGPGQTAANCVSVWPESYQSYQPWNGYYPTYTVTTAPARPIRLSMAEVEKLRKLAKADESVKAILQKFTGQIEIEVAF